MIELRSWRRETSAKSRLAAWRWTCTPRSLTKAASCFEGQVADLVDDEQVVALELLLELVAVLCDAACCKAEGLSKREIIRCLKRYIARETYHLLTAETTP